MLTIGINRAVSVIAEAGEKGKPRTARELGPHPSDGEPVTQGRGRFGPYVKHRRVYASIPKGQDPETITLEEAVALVDAKAAKKGAGKKAGAKKATAKKAGAKKGRGQKGRGQKGRGQEDGGKKGRREEGRRRRRGLTRLGRGRGKPRGRERRRQR